MLVCFLSDDLFVVFLWLKEVLKLTFPIFVLSMVKTVFIVLLFRGLGYFTCCVLFACFKMLMSFLPFFGKCSNLKKSYCQVKCIVLVLNEKFVCFPTHSYSLQSLQVSFFGVLFLYPNKSR